MNPIQRKYGEATTIYFPVYNTAGDEFYTAVSTLPSGDAQISVDGSGTTSDTTNQPGKWSNGMIGVYKLILTATEMEGAHIAIRIVDQTDPKVFMDTIISIETYGHASAQHQMDMDFPTLAKSFTTTAIGTTTTLVCSDLGATDDNWIDRTILFHNGTLDGRIAFIEDYVSSTNTLSISQIHATPASGQAFYVL